MTILRSLCLLAPAACLLAQAPPPAPQPAGQPPPPAVALSVAQPDKTVAPDKVIITVGDRKITAAEFDRIVASMPEQYRAAARGPNRTQFANNLVQMLVLAQEGRRQKLDQTTEFKTLMEFQNENALAIAAAAELAKSYKPDDAQLRKYYDEHKSEFEQAATSHILVRFQGSQVPVKPGQKDLTDAEALAKIQALRQRIEGGEDFAKLAAQESDDTGSGAKGGDLGSITHGQTVPAFEQAAFALKPGELSQPVKTAFGYHLIKVTSRDAKTFEAVEPDLERQLAPPLLQKATADLVKKASVTLDPESFPPAPRPSSVRTRKLEIACPVCGSSQVFYTCTTDCCYNHVCGDCGATFEPVTKPAGGALSGIAPPDPPPECSDPTAACARCHAPSACMTEDGAVVCAICGALLILELEEIHPA